MTWVEAFDGEEECPECQVVICHFCQGQNDIDDEGCGGKHTFWCSYQHTPVRKDDL